MAALYKWSPLYQALDHNRPGSPESRARDPGGGFNPEMSTAMAPRRRGQGGQMLSDDPLNINNRPGYSTLR